MSHLDSVMAALADRVDAIADLLDEAAKDRRDDNYRAGLGQILAKHAKALTGELRERTERAV